jgi:general secretion pathway protein J
MMKNKQESYGFTLIEILITLFIFSILSVILISALGNVINIQSGTENKARRLRQLQLTLLIMSRDIEQAVNRPIINSSGKEEGAFIGKPDSFALTHMGLANPPGTVARGSLQRSAYTLNENGLSRLTWLTLDQASKAKPLSRHLLDNVSKLHFEYLDQQGRFYDQWPLADNEVLPVGVKVNLTIKKWGNVTQFYLISAQTRNNFQSKPDEKEVDK